MHRTKGPSARLLSGPWDAPKPKAEEVAGEERTPAAEPEPVGPNGPMPKREPGETGLAFARRVATWLGAPIPPEDPPPPPPGKLRVPRDVVPYRVRLEQIWRGRETGEEG